MLDQPHDHLVRAVFGDPARAAAELRAVLPPSLTAELDLASLQPAPANFVDEALRGRAADLLFTARTRDGDEAFVHLLIEHQSTPDRWMAFRLLDYQRQIWARWRREHAEAGSVPRIVPVVLYHGERAWPHPTRFLDLLPPSGTSADRERDPLNDGALDFRWWLDDLTRLTDEQLRTRLLDAASLLALLALKHARTATDLGDRLLSWTSLMSAAARAPGGREVLLLVLRYLSETSQQISPSFLLHELAPRLEDESSRETTMTLADALRAEGREIGQRELLRMQLERRFGRLPAEVVRKLEQAPPARIEEWALRFVDARSLDEALAE